MDDLHKKHYESLGALIDYLDTAPRPWVGRESERRNKTDWYGTSSYGEAVTLARFGGWNPPELVRMRDAIELPVNSRANEQRITFRPSVAGVRPNVPAYIAGTPECLWEPVMQDTERRVVRVCVQRNYSYKVSTTTAIEAGALVLGYLAELEVAHLVTTELVIASFDYFQGRDGKPTVKGKLTVTVKRAGQPFDLSELAFSLAHPSMLRRIIFRYYETLPAESESEYYSVPRAPLPEEVTEFDLFIPGPDGNSTYCVRKAIEKARAGS